MEKHLWDEEAGRTFNNLPYDEKCPASGKQHQTRFRRIKTNGKYETWKCLDCGEKLEGERFGAF